MLISICEQSLARYTHDEGSTCELMYVLAPPVFKRRRLVAHSSIILPLVFVRREPYDMLLALKSRIIRKYQLVSGAVRLSRNFSKTMRGQLGGAYTPTTTNAGYATVTKPLP